MNFNPHLMLWGLATCLILIELKQNNILVPVIALYQRTCVLRRKKNIILPFTKKLLTASRQSLGPFVSTNRETSFQFPYLYDVLLLGLKKTRKNEKNVHKKFQ
jgi:hypothetical protein